MDTISLTHVQDTENGRCMYPYSSSLRHFMDVVLQEDRATRLPYMDRRWTIRWGKRKTW